MLEYPQKLMKLLPRVVWSEGMYLGPHHFQAQARYFEDSIRFTGASFWFAPYGLAGIELDSDAISNGMVSLLHARGIFRDGLPFNMPEGDGLPEPRSIGALFPPTSEGVIVRLGIPPRRPDGLNCFIADEGDGAQPPAPDSRYVAEFRMLHDENTGGDERRVRLGRKNLRILFDTEPAGDMTTLPLARVVRDGSGRFIYDPSFIPPLLQIVASMRLTMLLQRLTDILEEKSASLKGGGLKADSTHQMAALWLLHSISASLGTLRHLSVARGGHPEELFRELSRLGGALCTFGLDTNARDLPLYDHDNLSECFDRIDRHIRAHLETTVPTNCLSIPLTSAEKYFYDGDIGDARVLNRARWVLALNAAMGEAELMIRAPQLVKVCSPLFVRELVKRALPGLELNHLPVPPPAISPRPEAQYFGIGRIGPCWDHIVKTRRVGVYLPGEFPDVSAEILVVLDT
jgi:type VI secretion system protein ImpJ